MKRTSVLLLTYLCLIIALWASADGASILVEFSTDRVKPLSSDELELSSSPMSMNSLANLAELGDQSSFRPLNGQAHKSAKGVKRMRLVQTYAGYDVFGSAAEAEMDANDNFSGHMYGEVVKNMQGQIANPEACQRKVSSLQDLAIRLRRLNPRNPNIHQRDARRIVFAGPTSSKAKLAYRVEFLYTNEGYVTRPVYFFDACTGFVLLTYDQINNKTINANNNDQDTSQGVTAKNEFLPTSPEERGNVAGAAACSVSAVGNGGNEKVGSITYNSQPYCLNVQRSLGVCKMEGTYSKVVDNENTQRLDKQTVAQFLCSTGYRDSVNGAYGVANDALYYGEICGRFFEETFSFRALPYKPRLVVHYGRSVQNAFWDGTDMYFGDGGSLFHPLVGLGVMAHELAHGVTTRNSQLVYRGMSGGINEAFSDITAEATEYFAENNYDWLIGADVVKETASIDAIRFFKNPSDDGKSIRHVLGYRPLMNVHYSSGVFNHAFYRMVQVERMDIMEAYKCFLDANLNLWKPFSNYFTAACNVMQAAYDNGFSHRKVRRAFWRVGVPLLFCNYAALRSSLFAGETRNDILVSATRSPVLKVELDKNAANTTFLEAIAGDNSKIQVEIGTDDEVDKVITSGENLVNIANSYHDVYVKLSSKSPVDIKVSLKVIK